MKIERRITGSYYTNSYIVSNLENECVVIDPGLDYLSTYKYIISKYKVKAILLTHAHIDHIDGLQYFDDVDVYIYKDELEALTNPKLNLYYTTFDEELQIKGLNIKTIDDGDILDLIGFKFEVIHTPGHTMGSVCYRLDDTIFTGDTLFLLSIGRTDFFNSDSALIIDSINKLMNKFDHSYRCLPGHGDVTDLDYEFKYNPFLKNIN